MEYIDAAISFLLVAGIFLVFVGIAELLKKLLDRRKDHGDIAI